MPRGAAILNYSINNEIMDFHASATLYFAHCDIILIVNILKIYVGFGLFINIFKNFFWSVNYIICSVGFSNYHCCYFNILLKRLNARNKAFLKFKSYPTCTKPMSAFQFYMYVLLKQTEKLEKLPAEIISRLMSQNIRYTFNLWQIFFLLKFISRVWC